MQVPEEEESVRDNRNESFEKWKPVAEVDLENIEEPEENGLKGTEGENGDVGANGSSVSEELKLLEGRLNGSAGQSLLLRRAWDRSWDLRIELLAIFSALSGSF